MAKLMGVPIGKLCAGVNINGKNTGAHRYKLCNCCRLSPNAHIKQTLLTGSWTKVNSTKNEFRRPCLTQ